MDQDHCYLLSDVENWIVQLGIDDIMITYTEILVGELENLLGIRSIILHSKKVIQFDGKRENTCHDLR